MGKYPSAVQFFNVEAKNMQAKRKSEAFPGFVTPAEAARIKGITRNAIWRLILSGKIETTNFDGHRYLSREMLDAYDLPSKGRVANS